MFGFRKKVQERIEPEFDSGDNSISSEEKKLSDILGAQENDTNITAGVDAILDEEGEIGDEQINTEYLDFNSIDAVEASQKSQINMEENFVSSPEEITTEMPHFDDLASGEAVSDVPDMTVENVSSQNDLSTSEWSEEGFENTTEVEVTDANQSVEKTFGEAVSDVPDMAAENSSSQNDLSTSEWSEESFENTTEVEVTDADQSVEETLGEAVSEIQEITTGDEVGIDALSAEVTETTSFSKEYESNLLGDVSIMDTDQSMEIMQQQEVEVEPILEETSEVDNVSISAEETLLQDSVEEVSSENNAGSEDNFAYSLEQNDIPGSRNDAFNEEEIIEEDEVSSDVMQNTAFANLPEGQIAEGIVNDEIIQDSQQNMQKEDDISLNVEPYAPISEKTSQEAIDTLEEDTSEVVAEETMTEINVSADKEIWSLLPLSELSDNPKTINQYSGVEFWCGDKYQQDIKLLLPQASDLDKWTCLIIQHYSVKLLSGVTDLYVEKPENVVRYASLMQNGVEKLKIFNQERYKFIAPQNDVFSVQGNVICGRIDESFLLDVQDYLSIPLHLFVDKVLDFKSPVSGMLIGPQGNKIYFANAQKLAIAVEEQVAEENFFEYLPPLHGIDNRNCFVFGEDSEETEFVGKGSQTHLVVKVGTSLYGWNVRFDDDRYMSLRDVLEYQARYKKLPSSNGEIIHDSKILKFYGVERIQARQKTFYYSYGKI